MSIWARSGQPNPNLSPEPYWPGLWAELGVKIPGLVAKWVKLCFWLRPPNVFKMGCYTMQLFALVLDFQTHGMELGLTFRSNLIYVGLAQALVQPNASVHTPNCELYSSTVPSNTVKSSIYINNNNNNQKQILLKAMFYQLGNLPTWKAVNLKGDSGL